MVSDHESGGLVERSRRALGLFRRRTAESSAAPLTGPRHPTATGDIVAAHDKASRGADGPTADGAPTTSHNPGAPDSDGRRGGRMARDAPEQEVVAEGIVFDAKLAAANLVAQGQTELMQARAEAALIQAEARERLVEAIRREQAVAEMESAVHNDDAELRSTADARYEAREIVASARRTAIGLLQEAQQLLVASRREAPASPRRRGSELPSTPESELRTGPDDPAIVLDLTADVRASRYARQSAKLPRIGEEAGDTLANMKRLRALSKGGEA